MGLFDKLFKGSDGPANPFPMPNIGDPNNPLGGSDQYFQELIKSLNLPSSSEGAMTEVNGELMKHLLSGIDTDLTKSIGDSSMDFASRGLAGPGQLSDIEANAAGDLREKALIDKNKTRLGFATTGLNAIADREKMKAEALGQRAGAGVSLLGQMRGNSADLWNSAEARKQAGKKPSWFDTMMSGFAGQYGKDLGGDSATGTTNLIKAMLLT